ncbi:MAG TPA: helix-turn-helix domain-containing protein [Acidimicrobiia bacterium]|nr:helix-turn-helix domain-containing protein [Acidimicrobiia bacterium]
MNDGKTFGQVVREARLAKGMSMGQLAAAVERSTASVRRWERDEGVPAETVVRDLIAVLDLQDDDYPGLPSRPPSVGVASHSSPSVPESMRATSLASASPSAASGPLPAVSQSRLERFRDPNRPWLGYARAGLTVVTLLLIVWVLIWALGGLVDAVGDIWQSLWSGAS